MERYHEAAVYASRIEWELRRLNVWRREPLPASAYESQQAFFADTMTFFQWLQFVLLPRVREIIAEKGAFPKGSSVGAYAIRELDGFDEGCDLVSLLCEFDECMNRRRRGTTHFPVDPPPMETPAEEPPKAPIPPDEVVRSYWQTRDPDLLVSNPHALPGYDTSLAGHVFQTATECTEMPGDPEEIAEGVIVRTVLKADRGLWLVLTALCKQRDEWRIDLPLSIGRTAMMFLHQQQIHPPYTNDSDARGRVMQWWQHVHNHDDRRARELLLDPLDEIPHFSDGQVDELFWYLSHTEADGIATVRVLMNTRTSHKIWLTRMAERGGAWFVDWPGTR